MPTVTGREYKRTRPRGFIENWNPKPETMDLIHQVRDVLNTYQAELPLTVRQIFYRLVGTVGYEKTETAYGRLANHLTLARRAGAIPFSAIRDDGTASQGAGGWWGADNYFENVRSWARNYHHDRSDGQPKHVEIWVEASGMVPQAARAARPYGRTVYSAGGFNGVTDKYETARRLSLYEEGSIVLHVGDWDPSGASIIDSLAEDVQAFVDGMSANCDIEFRRIAVRPEQIAEFGLITAPQKHTDNRGEYMAETVQAEAIDPTILASLIAAAIEAETDMEQLEYVRSLDETERAEIQERLARI